MALIYRLKRTQSVLISEDFGVLDGVVPDHKSGTCRLAALSSHAGLARRRSANCSSLGAARSVKLAKAPFTESASTKIPPRLCSSEPHVLSAEQCRDDQQRAHS